MLTVTYNNIIIYYVVTYNSIIIYYVNCNIQQHNYILC